MKSHPTPEKSIAKVAKLLNSPKRLKVKGDGKKSGSKKR